MYMLHVHVTCMIKTPYKCDAIGVAVPAWRRKSFPPFFFVVVSFFSSWHPLVMAAVSLFKCKINPFVVC